MIVLFMLKKISVNNIDNCVSGETTLVKIRIIKDALIININIFVICLMMLAAHGDLPNVLVIRNVRCILRRTNVIKVWLIIVMVAVRTAPD